MDRKFWRCFYIYMLCAQVIHCRGATQVGVNNKVDGDQTVGGVHLFELHSPNGGMGIGVKVLVAAIIVGIIFYWCVTKRIKKCKQAVLPYQAAAQYLPQVPRLTQQLAMVHPQPPAALYNPYVQRARGSGAGGCCTYGLYNAAGGCG